MRTAVMCVWWPVRIVGLMTWLCARLAVHAGILIMAYYATAGVMILLGVIFFPVVVMMGLTESIDVLLTPHYMLVAVWEWVAGWMEGER